MGRWVCQSFTIAEGLSGSLRVAKCLSESLRDILFLTICPVFFFCKNLVYTVLTFLNLVSVSCEVKSNFDATLSQQFTFIFLSLKSPLYLSYKQTYFCTSSIKISVLITLEAFLILSFASFSFPVLSVISLAIFVAVPQSVNVAIAVVVAVTNAAWDSFESLTVFLGLSSVFPYNFGSFRVAGIELVSISATQSLWVYMGKYRSFSCVSIWSFTIFHRPSQNCATLRGPQRQYGNQVLNILKCICLYLKRLTHVICVLQHDQ